MSGRRAWRAVALSICLLAVAPAAAEDVAVRLQYEVRYGILSLLSLQVATDLDGPRYRSRVRTETQGVVGVLYPWSAQTEAVGVREGVELHPRRHRSEGTYRSERRSVEIDYDDDGSVRSRVEPPPEEDWRHAVPAALQQATIDPITAGLRAVSSNCQGTLPVFDGRRRYDLRLESLGEADLPQSGDRVYAGPTQRCRAQVEALAGFWRVDPRDSEQPTYLDAWIASPRPGMPRVPVYLELTGARGTLKIDLTKADPAPAG